MDKSDRKYRPLDPNTCPDQAMLLDYLRGGLDRESTRALELHLASCPLCSDAAEGLAMMNNPAALDNILADTREKLFGATEPVTLKAEKSPSKKKGTVLRIMYIGIAASIGLFLISYLAVKFLPMNDKQEQEISYAPNVNKTEEQQKEPAAAEEKGPALQEQQTKTIDIPTSKNNPGIIAGLEQRTEIPAMNDKDASKDQSVLDLLKSNGYFEYANTVTTTTGKGDAAGIATEDAEKSKEADDGIVAEEKVLEITTVNGTSVKNEDEVTVDRSTAKKEARQPASGEAIRGGADAQAKVSQTEVNDALSYYNAGDYRTANTRFNTILASSPGREDALYYNGMALYYLKRYNEALKSFSDLMKNKQSMYYQSAEWQTALIYIESGNTAQARKILNRIIDGNGNYRNAAEEAIKNLGGQ